MAAVAREQLDLGRRRRHGVNDLEVRAEQAVRAHLLELAVAPGLGPAPSAVHRHRQAMVPRERELPVTDLRVRAHRPAHGHPERETSLRGVSDPVPREAPDVLEVHQDARVELVGIAVRIAAPQTGVQDGAGVGIREVRAANVVVPVIDRR